MIDKITQYKIQQAKELLLLETDVAMFLIVHLACDTIALNEKYVDVCLFENSCMHWISGTQCPQIGTKSNLQAI